MLAEFEQAGIGGYIALEADVPNCHQFRIPAQFEGMSNILAHHAFHGIGDRTGRQCALPTRFATIRRSHRRQTVVERTQSPEKVMIRGPPLGSGGYYAACD